MQVRTGDVLRGTFGYALLGGWAMVGDVEPLVAMIAGASAAAAVARTTPTLLITHAFLGLEGPVESVATAPIDAFVRSGRVALWLSPVLLLFAAAGNAEVLYGLAFGGLVARPKLPVVFLRGVQGDAFSEPAKRAGDRPLPPVYGEAVSAGATAIGYLE